MFKTCSDPDFNWVHCLCDSATWVVKEPGKPIGFFYSRLFDDALSASVQWRYPAASTIAAPILV